MEEPERVEEEETKALSPVPDPGPPQNVMEALIARRQEHVAERNYDLEVPGMGGLLVLRLKALSARQLQVIADKAEKSKSPTVGFNVNADTLIAATEFVLGRARPDDELTVLPGADGEPLGIGVELAEMLKLETVHSGSSRQVLLGLFDRSNAPVVALGSATAEYLEWCSSENQEIDEETLGES